MSDEVKLLAKADAELFGGNISAYVSYLILDANKHKINFKKTDIIAPIGESAKAKAKQKKRIAK